MPRVAILGTGLIGSSIGLALKQRGEVRDLEIVGFDRYRSTANASQKAGALDKVENEPSRAVRGAGLVILAAPVLANRRLMEEIADALEDGAVVTDTGSTKAETMRWAAELMPSRVTFIGGHPMAGKTEAGPRFADPALFEDSRWVVVAPPGAPSAAIESVTNLANAVGAEPMFMDAQEHDAYVAAISHVPMLLSTALFRTARASEAWPELSLLAAGGFKDATRLTATDPAMAYDIAVTNSEQILHWLDRFRGALLDLKELLEAGEERRDEYFKLIAQNEFEYTAYRAGKVGREADSSLPDSSGFDFGSFLMGEVIKEKMQEINRDQEKRLEDLDREQRMRRNV
ncbi:MAG: prephenate dehydrogenase/arogenate dehydrogenase family protein [Dehalococcoidia bacterium]|nr:prephenate dehydrogenase/arogenate dehydrogenase family protein [Dehalococcoidia bacterium]